ncbi:MAG: Asp-tRNA(Asn)/Glu-tRNA(Gln) amidotransferase subunit GatA [Gammaproteobacteria bacterium]|nr:Asp-tRNA(Asn)/Glu-tRNA(Gln) amidotransferase subunit GatA [Gammaproteobacteria bacterium]
MNYSTIAKLKADLAAKKISSLELTQHYIQRIKKLDPKLNSFITVTEEIALAQARHADQLIASGKIGQLTGIPIAQKDIFCTKGVKTSCASKMLDNFISPYDAHIIENFNNDGSIMLGKTNMDEFAMGSSNETSFYGLVRNPWNLDYIPGGSSGGSAAAVAAGLAAGATGTDTGGSIRQPAAMCGLTGIKPTYGRVSRYGMIAFASSLDQGGPMALTAEDCAIMLNVMTGFDKRDSTCVDHPIPDYTKTLGDSIKGLTIGIPDEFFAEGLDPKVAEVIQAAIKEFEKLGAKVKSINLPHNHLSIGAYYIIAPAEASSNLARFDGVRYGYRCENPKDLQDLYKRSRSEGFGNEVKRRIMMGTYALSSGYYDAYYTKALKIRRLLAEDFQKAFEEVDVIMGPTTPTVAFKLGEKTHDPVSMYLSDIYTLAVNLAGLPGISVPAGFVNGLPVGLQLIGKLYDEAKLLNIAHQYQQVTDWHTQHPDLENLA